MWSSHTAEYGSTGYGCQSCSWSAEHGKLIFPCPVRALRIWSRETGSAVSSRVSLLISTLRPNLVYLRDSSRVPRRRPFIYLNHHTPSGQSREFNGSRNNCVPMAFTTESPGTGQVNLKVVPNECCLGWSPWTNYYVPLFPTPTVGMKAAPTTCLELPRG